MTVHELIEELRTIPNQQMEVVFFKWQTMQFEGYVEQWWTEDGMVVLADD